MQKKYVFLWCLLLSIASSANAYYYFGAGIGATMGSLKMQLTYPVDQPNPTTANYTYALSTFTPQVSLGYRHLLNKRWRVDTVLSAQFNLGAAITKIDNWYPPPQQINSYTSITLPLVYAADILAAYQLNAAVTTFIGPGIALGELKSTSHDTGGVSGISGNYSKNLLGPQLMAGVDLFLTNTCTIRLSDQLTLFPATAATWVEPVTEKGFTGRYTLSTNTVLASILYDF